MADIDVDDGMSVLEMFWATRPQGVAHQFVERKMD